MVQQNMRVFKFAVIPFMAALVLLAGCSTSTEEDMPPDWSGGNGIHRLTNSPPLAVTTNVLKTNLPPIVHSNQPPVQAAPLQVWTSLDRWAKDNKVPPPRHLSASPLSTWSLTTLAGTLVLAIGSHEVTWNGYALQLAFPPQIIDDGIFINDWLQKNLEPLLTAATMNFPDTNRVIVIDPTAAGGINDALNRSRRPAGESSPSIGHDGWCPCWESAVGRFSDAHQRCGCLAGEPRGLCRGAPCRPVHQPAFQFFRARQKAGRPRNLLSHSHGYAFDPHAWLARSFGATTIRTTRLTSKTCSSPCVFKR